MPGAHRVSQPSRCVARAVARPAAAPRAAVSARRGAGGRARGSAGIAPGVECGVRHAPRRGVGRGPRDGVAGALWQGSLLGAVSERGRRAEGPHRLRARRLHTLREPGAEEVVLPPPAAADPGGDDGVAARGALAGPPPLGSGGDRLRMAEPRGRRYGRRVEIVKRFEALLEEVQAVLRGRRPRLSPLPATLRAARCVAPCRHRGAPPPRGAGGHTSRALTAPRSSIIFRWSGRPGRVRCSRGSACFPFSPRIPSQAREDMQVYELLSGIRPQHRTTSGPKPGLVFPCGERSAKLGAMSDPATHTIQTRAPRRSLKFPGLVRTRTRSNPDLLHFQKKLTTSGRNCLGPPNCAEVPPRRKRLPRFLGCVAQNCSRHVRHVLVTGSVAPPPSRTRRIHSLHRQWTMLAAGLYSGRLKLVDANTGCTRHDIEGHEGMVSCVALSQDGRLLASGSRDRSVRIFCAWSGLERLVMRGHDAQSDCKVSQNLHSP